MVSDPQWSWTCWVYDTLWHDDSLEFNIWHAGFCHWAYCSNKYHHWRLWYEIEAVWAQWRQLEFCMPASGCSQGMMLFSISICPNTYLLYRYSRMQLYSSPKGHRALPLSSPPWITLMSILPLLPLATNTLSQSRLPLQLAKRLLTTTMTKQISLRCRGSQWVWLSSPFCFFIISHLLLASLCTLITSSNTSRTQDGRMTGLNRQRRLSAQNLIYHMDPWTQVGWPCRRLNPGLLKPK